MDIPKTWRMVPLGELGKWGSGGTPPRSRSELYGGNIPWLKIGDLTDGPIWEAEEAITKAGLENSSAKLLAPGTILLAMYGSIGKIGITKISCATNQAIAFCICDDELIDQRYLFWGLRHLRPALIALGQGGTQQNISQTLIKQVPLPVAPRCEQRKIVEKIETLFAELDKGEESLRQVQTLLARYRQSVLKAAVTGELTADWRAERAGKFEHGRDLLERVLQTRRKTWEGRGRYSEPSAPKSGDLPELPEGWVWTTVEQLLRAGLSNGRSVPDAQEGFPVLRLTALKDGWIDLSERKIGAWEEESARGFLIQSGDILVSRGNGSKRLVGRGGLVLDEPDPVAYPDTMIKVPLLLDHISADWFVQLWNSPFMREQIEKAAKTTAGIYKINQTDIRSFKVPLPSLEEQLLIAEKVGETSEALAALESQCGKELSRSAALRQSILKDAFSGRLVPQNPNDEPASELLARIRRSQEAGRAAKQMK